MRTFLTICLLFFALQYVVAQSKIDSVMNKAIKDKCTPGAYVLAIHHDSIIFSKAYGKTTYNGADVNDSMLYDLASLTKILATLPIVMHLYSEHLLRSDMTIGDFLDVTEDKKNITIQQLLLHCSGLPATIDYKSLTYDETYKNVYSAIDSIKLKPAIYRYSDLNFIYLQRIIESLYDDRLEYIFRREIAEPLGITHLLYNPLRRYDAEECVPTQRDVPRGMVHDQIAALLDGSAGNAGLFGTAEDIAKIAKLFLNKGQYNGVRLWDEQTDSLFHIRPQPLLSRRSLGFDRPEHREGLRSPVTSLASDSSYGHSGFTGTLLWIDPEKEMIYIFLSNRIYPNVENNRLTRNNIRGKIHTIIYESIVE